ncbi:hypothetical protein [Psychroserpens ponticola]|uniref:Uncharacterized protein n=1 Tax=Psychroserpens ponticola TaxID=2932268 RepID=A0ABY7S3Q2_9FLAO|nr:hypothetical protein [Psychroserpens ponticola]WCO00225.1 hypothetical protein MUN68_009070 [Psychroserpens ponticola]WCO03531.1 hypothetical protein MUN68_008485 [Psychroserpens ponticola]
MTREITIIFLFIFFISCSNEKVGTDTFYLSNSIDKTNFIPSPQNSRIFNVKINDSAYLKLPDTDEYDWTIKDAYRINDNWINNDTIYVEKFHNHYNQRNGKRDLSILKLKKSLNYKVYDSIGFDSINVNRAFLSPDKTQILTLENRDKKTVIRIFENKQLKSITDLKKKFIIEQQCWSDLKNEIVLSNEENEIYTYNLTDFKLNKLNAKGNKPIWLNGTDLIACINDNKVNIYSLSAEESIFIIKPKNKLFYTEKIEDYYWFEKEQKLLLRIRYTLMEEYFYFDEYYYELNKNTIANNVYN